MKWSIGTKIGVGYVPAVVGLVIISLASYSSVKHFIATAGSIEHNYHVINGIDDLVIDLLNVETGGRGYVITGDESYLAPYTLGNARVGDEIAALRKLTAANSFQQQNLKDVEALVAQRLESLKGTIDLQKGGDHEGAENKIKLGTGKRTMDQIREVTARMKLAATDLITKGTNESNANARNTILIIILGVTLASVLLSIIGFFTVRRISNPLQKITVAAEKIAAGDLDVAINANGRMDEVGVLERAFSRMAGSLQETAKGAGQVASGNLAVLIKPQSSRDVLGNALGTMVSRLSSLIEQVQKSGIQVTTSATEISATGKGQQATANEIFSTTTEIGATAKEISATSKELVRAMKAVTEVAEETATLASTGQTGLVKMETTMKQIMEASGSINARLAVLSEKAGSINTVVTTITKVADQTNLLSLNAAIEAEKAGEYGRGFAVVATEIRRLADQTAAATSDIEQMVNEMQSAVSAGVMGMDKFSEEVRRGVEVVGQVSTQLTQIIQQVQTLTPNFETVNEGMQSQSLGAQQISEALAQLGETAQQTVESLRQSNLAIEQLNEATAGLQSGVSRFKLEA